MFENQQNQETAFYQTGRTQPPKKRGGLFALVLVAFIFLSGIVSVLGLLNIQLFHRAEKRENPVSFSKSTGSSVQPSLYEEHLHLPDLGISGAFTDPIDQLLYSLPQGFYISSVEEGSAAAAKGLLPGDVIQGLDGKEADSLQTLLSGLQEKQSVRLVISRGDRQFSLDIVLK